MSEPHTHFPDYAYYYSRHTPKRLTCIHCGKPIYCTNDHLTWLGFLLVVPAMIAFAFHKGIAMVLFIIAFILNDLVKRVIFPKLHFEIDNDAIRGDMTRYRNRK